MFGKPKRNLRAKQSLEPEDGSTDFYTPTGELFASIEDTGGTWDVVFPGQEPISTDAHWKAHQLILAAWGAIA